jgi:predicted Zn-dependent protease
MPELGPQEYATIEGYYDSTGALTTAARAEAAAQGIRNAQDAGLFVAAGYMDVVAGSQAVATSKGLFGFHQQTSVASTLTVRTPDDQASGWANDWTQIESERIARVASEKAAAWRGATELEPGAYACILEPTAVGMLMLRLVDDLDARTADEGRSYFSKPGGGNRIGETLFDSRVTIVSDPVRKDAETAPFNSGGERVARTVWIDNGALKNLAYGRFWADKQGRAPLPRPQNLIMEGGTYSVESMIAATERGVLITRFWYIRGLNPRTISYTGLTRDGTFLIENGKIARPVKNFRFNQSLGDLLKNVEMIGPTTRVAASENSSVDMPIVVPPLKVREFNLASVSDAI